MAKQFRNRANNDYLLAIGRAFYSFALLEHNVKHIIFKLDSVGAIPEKATAGRIHTVLRGLVNAMVASPLKTELEDLLTQFNAQVEIRNSLLHATPYTAAGGEQQIGYNYTEWTTEGIYDAAFIFEEVSILANDILHRIP